MNSLIRMTKSRSLASAVRNVHIERKIEELGYTLPTVAEPKGNYRTSVRSGNTIYMAGHLPQPAGGDLILGKVGKDLTPEQGYEAAHYVALSLMATLKQEVGDLDKIKRVVKLVGFVNCVDGFTQQPAVINGASDTIGKVFGDKGIHARSAVGTNALPLNVAVEVEAVVEIED
ncbi:YjgF/chorismate mutase-like putative endoribonuclease [Phytophthora infestans]|uniref:Putative YjgF/chorismate mutase-like endoribonuclease n=1 Tax=Phytophthora infestans TaxID=4787 RepID=A0A833RZP7_PHYIN|nr:YjgF/chorismate mutase-like putative endoribonuclease [Phytophthora infestans]KAF4137140.1 putative YjgF/chorismate mutase-like endoribonuclease [Phytophthora infestans]KAF4139744.1 putative YjgF/chorismate mutase-like endoribonuclease [Phytophthora infestans]